MMKRTALALAQSALVFSLGAFGADGRASDRASDRASGAAASASPTLETATFATGCFWGAERFFGALPGVKKTRVGYAGGSMANPTYAATSKGTTGHAESVEIQFDPKQISYVTLLDQFFKMHDPTTRNRQGNDVGSQYRSAIFYHGAKQKAEALAFEKKVEASGAWKAPITTEIAEAKTFWPAEPEHQKYCERNDPCYDNHRLRDLSFDPPASAQRRHP